MSDKPVDPKEKTSDARGSAEIRRPAKQQIIEVQIRNSDALAAAEERARNQFAPRHFPSAADEFAYRLLLRCLNYIDEASLTEAIASVFELMRTVRDEDKAALQSREEPRTNSTPGAQGDQS